MPILNKADDKFDIIVLAGQSNAEGNGYGDVENPYLETSDIKMLTGDYEAKVKQTSYGNDYLYLKVFDEYTISNAKERISEGKTYGNLALTFAERYRQNDLAKDRKILILNAAIGGTGFAKRHWGVGDLLYKRMTDMAECALKMNKQNRIVAMLWHQGEHDAFEEAELNYDQRKDKYVGNLSALIEDFRARFGRIPVICGKFAKTWADDYRLNCEAIYEATRIVCDSEGDMKLVETEDLHTSHMDTGSGDHVHFSRAALYELGERYYKEFKKIINTK